MTLQTSPIASAIERALSLYVLLALLAAPACDRRQSTQPQTNPPLSAEVPRPVPLTNMVLIKSGSFIRSGHTVTVSHDFWLGKYEVTQREYHAVTGINPSHFKEDPDCPVEKVRWTEAAAFCRAVTERERQAHHLPTGYEYRLPTEAEWEYACRAGTTNLYSFGDDPTVAGQFAWTLENSDGKTHPVGQKLPNPWGLHDVHGNAWEWCSDWFAPFPTSDTRDPIGPGTGTFKVFRGGGWNNAVELARSANRFMMSPTNGIYFVGFRLALGPVLQPPR
jgi:formylglycine-generating enzyme required for sulfatase activity